MFSLGQATLRSLSSVAILFLYLIFTFESLDARPRISVPKPPAPLSVDEAIAKIKFYEDRRLSRPDFLLKILSHPSSEVRRQAILALGRIGDPFCLDELARLLTKRREPLKETIIFSLGLIGGDTALKILSQNLPMQSDISTRAELIRSIGRIGNESSVKTVAAFLQPDALAVTVSAVCEALGTLWSKDSLNWTVPPNLLSRLAKISQESGDSAVSAAFALSRFKGEGPMLPGDAIVLAAEQAKNPIARMLLVRTLKKTRKASALATLIRFASDPSDASLRIESVKGLTSFESTPESLKVLTLALTDSTPAIVLESLRVLSNYRSVDANIANAIYSVYQTSRFPWIKGTALEALAKLDPDRARPEVMTLLKSADGLVLLRHAVRSLGLLNRANDVQTLAQFLDNTPVLVAETALETFLEVDKALLPLSLKTTLGKLLDRNDVALTSLVAKLAEQHDWKDFVKPLTVAYLRMNLPEHLEARMAILEAIAQIGDESSLPLLKVSLQDPERPVIETGIHAYEAIVGAAFPKEIPLNSKVLSPSPDIASLKSTVKKTVILKTTRGEIHIALLEEAPLTALNFLQLVKKGFYSDKVFHRVVPNFVVQGGDPRGDGYGGPGYFVRDEFSNTSHAPGTVGLATAGKDTGGSQFFINLVPNYHLNGRYTVFGRVTHGMSVAEKIQQGDKILSASVAP